MTTEEILETLRDPGPIVPEEALEEAARRRDEFIPLLIAEIETATRLGSKADVNDFLPVFALYLLAQFQESRALEPILDYFALHGTTENDYFGEIFFEDGGRILAALGRERPEALENYVRREGLNSEARWAALDALALQALWGQRPDGVVIEFFNDLFDANAFGDNAAMWTYLVCSCMMLDARTFLGRIQALYERNLVDAEIAGDFEDLELEAREDPKLHRRTNAEGYPPILDTAVAVSWWGIFNDPEDEWDDFGEPVPYVPGVPIRNAPKIGRNDPCPCGSGKKYKKCCLRAD
jgi:Protein of unknown function (DUF1186)/SEC-C motif